MDRNNMRSSYVNSGPRSLPHMGNNKRHNGNGHHARLSPPAQPPHIQQDRPMHNNISHNNQQDDIINYIYESWNKVTRELERGSEEAKYYQEMPAHQLANFRPFNLEEWWARRLMQNVSRNKHRS